MTTYQTLPRFFVPEVVQTSETDCGPAALKSLLEGYGIYASYGRLREACQTSVDGTSIDTIEQIAAQLGLNAEQVMIPSDHLLLPEAQALPALVVVRQPNDLLHFVIVWRVHGPFIQLMDPARGRRWVSQKELMAEVFIHRFAVNATAFRKWFGSDDFLAPLRRRFNDLLISESSARQWLETGLSDSSWRALGALDAATRMTSALVRSGGLVRGESAENVLNQFFQSSFSETSADQSLIPAPFWFAQPLAAKLASAQAGEQVILRGAVLVRVRGLRPEIATPAETGTGKVTVQTEGLTAELAAALEEPPLNPERTLLDLLQRDGLVIPTILFIALAMAALAITAEAFLLQGAMGMVTGVLVDQRLFAAGILFIFVLALLALELPMAGIELRIGRRLEMRLRIAFLGKIPKLSDRFFHSRLISDMAMRAHDLHQLHQIPELAIHFLRGAFQLIFTVIGVVILDPISAPLAIGFTIVFSGVVAVTTIFQNERQMRLVTHTASLSRFYLDALLGLLPARLHSAERSIRREHESLLTEWANTSLDTWRFLIAVESLGALLYAFSSIAILFNFIQRGGDTSRVLLLFYWTLNLPVLAHELLEVIEHYPLLRNDALRILEPLGAPDEYTPTDSEDEFVAPLDGEEIHLKASDLMDSPNSPPVFVAAKKSLPHAVEFEMQNVAVLAGGRTILREINLRVQPGEHVAIVGPSGAGKSSLVGILLGWHKPSKGSCRVDGIILEGEKLYDLRRETAWVDPAVQLWNRALLENLQYGNENGSTALSDLLERADLVTILERLPDGLQTVLGESGGLVSGGEGQRVRLGRAMNREKVRLAILDEPFRGLDREKRRALLAQAREHWRGVTFLCCTHDVAETQAFDRVLVIEEGRIIEDAAPKILARR
ncbi:MAG: ATP-binding cassette domain-containing protein, partial [Chloroflexi bacterium]|nr:ATP-binding cassette domain-containing protein [Chloroflexota bacterium]